MMPEAAALDRALDRAGEPATLRLVPENLSVACAAWVRGYRPAELVGSLIQGDSRIVLAPSAVGSMRRLRKGDKITVQGFQRNIEAVSYLYGRGGVLARIELTVRG
jgi:hypothetical protein